MSERIITFGSGGNLIGILAEPEPAVARSSVPAVLFWNVGINHRIGPHRIFVDMARRLAEAGYPSLRFDISGMGDSEASRADPRPEYERAAADVRAAMQVLKARRGIQRFILVGFCSSVDSAHAVGSADAEVAGVIYLEGYTFKTARSKALFGLRFIDKNRWERLLRLKFPTLFGEPAQVHDRALEGKAVFQRDYPTIEKFRSNVLGMLGRGTKLLFIYVRGASDYVYRDQLLDILGDHSLDRKLDLEFYPEADHTFFLHKDRQKVISRVVRWMQDRFPGERLAEAQPKSSVG